MGWFKRIFHKISHKVKKFNWADLADKGKRGWSVGTQILGVARQVVPKLKQVAQIAALVPGLSEYALPVVAGLDTAGKVLNTIDIGRQAVEKEFPSIVRNSRPKGKGIPSKPGRAAPVAEPLPRLSSGFSVPALD